jgi:hypothetical protein
MNISRISMTVLLIATFALFQGCTTAAKVSKVTRLPEKTITLSFTTNGFDDAELRADAKKQADDFCNGPAKFMSEEVKNEGASVAWGNLSKDEGTYLTFACR